MRGNKEARPTPAPAAAEADAASAVLRSKDLLPEILLRVGLPTCLVRAAAVRKRWLRIARDPAFLRRFRERHPPRLLGFYANVCTSTGPQFMPVSQAPELATTVRRASTLDDFGGHFYINDCRNGRLLVTVAVAGADHFGTRVLSPLQPTRGTVVLPPAPRLQSKDSQRWFFLPEDDSEDGAISVEVKYTQTGLEAQVRALESGIWGIRTNAAVVLTEAPQSEVQILPPVHGKIYMTFYSVQSHHEGILELDLAAARISVIPLPDRVRTYNFRLSCGEDAGLSLVHAEGSLPSIWSHIRSGNGAHDWVVLGDTIRVHEAWNRDDDVLMSEVDSNLEYVFMWMKVNRLLISMHLRSKTEKAYDARNFPNL
ncbi:hypothetical protein BAE44_0021085, partial [Dichanthelium oligosanthes]